MALELERELAKEGYANLGCTRGDHPTFPRTALDAYRFSLEGRWLTPGPEPGVAELARGEQGSLQEELAALQLQLESFAVHAHPREDDDQ